MSSIKRIVLIIAIFIVATVDVLIYLNIHIYYQAEKTKDSAEKIKILEKAVDFYPSNDLIFFELGRAYFDLALNNLSNKSSVRSYLQKAIDSYYRSLKSNPASYFCHFYLANALLNISYLFPSFKTNSIDEYKKASKLAGENSQIFFEAAKIFLSNWAKLSNEDKKFTINILRKIVSKKDKKKFRSILFLWKLNLEDHNIIEKILPEDPKIYRMYAEFIGEESLSLNERQKFLAKAEFLEFEKAKREYNAGEYEFFYYRMKEAFNHFKSCLNILKKIRFYQNLSQHNLINFSEFNDLLKLTSLNLAKCYIEQGKGLKEVEGYLYKYLSMEDRVAALVDLESYLKNKGLIGERLERSFNDLDRLSFVLTLYFKQSRYRDIINIGRLLQKSFIVIPKDKKKSYVQVLQIVGESYQNSNYMYEAEYFYQKALEIDPENIRTLVRLRRHYEKLEADKKVSEIDAKILKIIFPQRDISKNSVINKGRSLSYKLMQDGRKLILELHFGLEKKEIVPLISVFFNGRVIWENYLKDEVLSLPINSKVGDNFLKINAVNRTIRIVSLREREK